MQTDEWFNKAIESGDLANVINYLINFGASPSTLFEGISPLYRACKAGHIDVVKTLLRHKADPKQKNDLSYKARWDKYWSVNDFDGEHGATPMKAAIKSGKVDIVEALIENKAPFDEQGTDGRTPLFTAIHEKKEELALLFIRKGARLDIKDHYGISLMGMAVRCQLLNVVKELAIKGAPLDILDEHGSSVLQDSTSPSSPEILSFLLGFENVRKLVNLRWLDKWTPISNAVREGCVASVRLLVEAKADLSFHYDGSSLLELANETLQKNISSNSKNPSKEWDPIIAQNREVLAYVEQVMPSKKTKKESISASPQTKQRVERNPTQLVTLSDGRQLPRVMVEMTLFQIQQAMKGAGEIGTPFLLCDLKDKSIKDDKWTPAPNPFCKTMDMKTHQLLDGNGFMLPDTKSIVKDCIVGDNFDIALRNPPCLSESAKPASEPNEFKNGASAIPNQSAHTSATQEQCVIM